MYRCYETSILLIYEWVICPLVQGQQCVWMNWLLSVLIFFFPRKCEGVFEVTVDLMDICQIWGCCCAMDLTFQLLPPILRIKNKKRNQFTHSLNHTMHSNLRESSITKITQSLVELGVWKFIHQLANRDDRQAICPTSLHSGECNDNNPQTSSHEFLERRINDQSAGSQKDTNIQYLWIWCLEAAASHPRSGLLGMAWCPPDWLHWRWTWCGLPPSPETSGRSSVWPLVVVLVNGHQIKLLSDCILVSQVSLHTAVYDLWFLLEAEAVECREEQKEIWGEWDKCFTVLLSHAFVRLSIEWSGHCVHVDGCCLGRCEDAAVHFAAPDTCKRGCLETQVQIVSMQRLVSGDGDGHNLGQWCIIILARCLQASNVIGVVKVACVIAINAYPFNQDIE